MYIWKSLAANLTKGPLGRTLSLVILTVLVFFFNLYTIYYFLQSSKESNTAPAISLKHEKVEKDSHEKIDLYSCDLTDNSLAVSALDRAKTESCRLRITEAACKLKNNVFHDKFPVSTCENHDSLLIGLRVGCFVDSSKSRTLDGFTYEFKSDNSHAKCQAHCYRAGFVYYGLEFGRECFCGDSLNSSSIDNSNCDQYACSGNETETCGGFNAIDVYRTGLKKQSLNPKAKYVDPAMIDSNSTEAEVRILFLLQLNGRNDRQVKRLLKAIYSPRHFYFIHVDQRQLYMLTEMKAVAAKLSNVYVSPDGHSTIWGGASLLTMVQDAIRRSLTIDWMSSWDYLINLSESDFPVLTLRELETQLKVNNGKTFLASHGYNTGRFLQKQGFEYVFLECEEHMWRIGKRLEFPRNIRVDGGSDWLVLHRKFAEYSISNEELPAKMRSLFASVILPVESFFHTLAYNSPFCDSVISSHLRLTNWNRKQGCRCARLKKVVDWCGCSPLVFKKAHVAKFAPERTRNRALYIARKFESLIDIDAISVAESQALGDRPHLIDSSHLSFNATFVNFYKADIDGYSVPNTLLARRLLSLSPLGKTTKFVSLLRIDIYKEHAQAPHLMVFTIQITDSLVPVQLLIVLKNKGKIDTPAVVDGFQLKSISFGTNIDHKEEIFRGITAYVDNTGFPTVVLRWNRLIGERSSVNENKTSPAVKYSWIDANGKPVATQTLNPYDSIYGSQFAELSLLKYNISHQQSGIWSVVVRNSSSGEKIASVTFPVFDPENPEGFNSLVDEFFEVKDSCGSGSCADYQWSTFYPDPKSDILIGYDIEKEVLR